MTVKLYVGHLAFHVTQAQIAELFSQVGEVTDPFLSTNRYTGKSDGFAFINLETDADARDAVARFNGYVLEGIPLTVHILVNSEKASIKKALPPPAPENVNQN